MESKKHIVFMVRYSVLVSAANAPWRIARESESLQEYADRLFEPGRLAMKLSSLEKVTLASLGSQSEVPGTKVWLLMLTSDALPADHFQKLESVISDFERSTSIGVMVTPIRSALELPDIQRSPYGGITQAFRGFMREEAKNFGEGELVCTVRLDDDDALCADFVKLASGLMTPNVAGFALSFPCGYEALFEHESGKFSNIRARYYPKIALGLSYVDKVGNGITNHVMTLGNHTSVDERVPVILDSRRPVYIRCRSGANDTGTPDFLNGLPLAPSLELLRGDFPFIRIQDESEYPVDTDADSFSWPREANLNESAFRLRGNLKRSAAKVAELERKLARLQSCAGKQGP